jgi:hypothetical protein
MRSMAAAIPRAGRVFKPVKRQQGGSAGWPEIVPG